MGVFSLSGADGVPGEVVTEGPLPNRQSQVQLASFGDLVSAGWAGLGVSRGTASQPVL